MDIWAAAAEGGEAGVNRRNGHRSAEETERSYATSEDFRKLFKEETQSLYLLSFLLTANHEKAEKCFVEGLDDCIEGNPVFHTWAHSWARRIIIHNALRMIAPDSHSRKKEEDVSDSANNPVSQQPPLQGAPFASVLALRDFDRFVYVLSVLERYADQNCAVLLGVSRPEVRETRLRALQHICDFERRMAARDVHHNKEQSCEAAKQPEANRGLSGNDLHF
jgi:hypothetical protein